MRFSPPTLILALVVVAFVATQAFGDAPLINQEFTQQMPWPSNIDSTNIWRIAGPWYGTGNNMLLSSLATTSPSFPNDGGTGYLALSMNPGPSLQGSELQSLSTTSYGYGYYETRMKVSAVAGGVASFFVIEAPGYGPHEYDYEFLLNQPWVTNSQMNGAVELTTHPSNVTYTLNLPFNPTTGFHRYGMLWTPGTMAWYVDGQLLHTTTSPDLTTNAKMFIMANMWSGQAFWGGGPPSQTSTSYYDWIRFWPNVTTPQVLDNPPTVSLTAPANGATYTTPASVTLTASASDGTVAKVDFYQGSTLLGTATSSPYTFTWNNVSGGSYSLTAVATDNQGATTTSSAATITVNNAPSIPPPSSNSLPNGVTLQDIDGGLNYFARWKNAFPTDATFFPIGVYPAELHPADLHAMGINFFLPMRDDNAGLWRPVMSGTLRGNDMAAVNAVPGFYAGGAFYADQPWGSRAVFNSAGDELDGNPNGWFADPPAVLNYQGQYGNWGGLIASAFVGVNSTTRSIDPTRPVFTGVTGCYLDGYHYWHYTLAEKQAIAASTDIMEYDMYPVVYRQGHVYDTYDQVNEVRYYCQNARMVIPAIEMDTMDQQNIYPLPAQTVAEVWNGIIAGARGIEYFDQGYNITDPTYTGNGHYAAGAMYNAIKAVNAQVTALAPVLNSSFANGFVNTNGQVSVMAKYYQNQFYVFAAAHATTSQNVTFVLTGISSGTATVLNESRSINISGGKFTDTFVDANAVHIYSLSGLTTTTVRTLGTVVSRKVHGGTQTFDQNLALTGTPTVECRSLAGGALQLVFTFNQAMSSASAGVTSGTGTISGTPAFSGNTATVNLTGVTDRQKLTVTLSSLNGSSSSASITLGILESDVSGDGLVNVLDLLQTRAASGQSLNLTNFQYDIGETGAINILSLLKVRADSGHSLP